MEISIVIPVFNSEDCLSELYRQISDSVDISHEVIYVNDYSTDHSWDEICKLGRNNSNVAGLNFRRNFGQDNAIMAGIGQAKGNYVVIMDDDLQHSPRDIQRLYDRCKEGFDVCFANFTVKKQRVWKIMGSWLNGKVAELMLDKPKSIYLSPFKIISRAIAKEIVSYTGPYPYVDGLILSCSSRLTQIEAEHSKRFAGRSSYSLIRSISVWGRHVTGFSVFPLRVATFTGIFASISGVFLAIYYVLSYFLTREEVEGWTTIVVLFLFLGGLILMALGIIGEYVGRSYLALNQKPQYSVASTVNLPAADNPR